MRLPAPLPVDLLTFFRTGHFDCLRILSDYVDALDGGASLAIDRWILARPEQTLLDVMSALNREHIDFAKTTHALGARPHAYVKLELASGVELQFDHRDDLLEDDDPNAMRLGAFSLQR